MFDRTSVRGFLRGRGVRELCDDRGNFHTTQPVRSTKLRAVNNLRRIEAIKLYDRNKMLGRPVSVYDPRYRHLHPTKGWKVRPA